METDDFPADGQGGAIEIRLEDVSQLFETMDPFPFRERDLARDADEYICGWASELPADRPLEIRIHLPAAVADSAEVRGLDASLSNYFGYRAGVVARELSDEFRIGRRALLIGLGVLGFCLLLGQVFVALTSYGRIGHFVEEGLIIVGWVALWRPLEIFLYDWWPIAQKKRLYRRLADARVGVSFYDKAGGEGLDLKSRRSK
ncbi:hypothetical protein GGQ99_000227 [Aminobacter niigataensis]|uniref:Uncharacterized protein n=1 Tax=Aminobacter niigataensis TaxID=83265 RepID=A0ABR6KVN5_9HYPH|nr:hypothetical protein [Aminobacter niigataensis]MBB4648505.1 hypothetical protein [Aminobacter niigataensis]